MKKVKSVDEDPERYKGKQIKEKRSGRIDSRLIPATSWKNRPSWKLLMANEERTEEGNGGYDDCSSRPCTTNKIHTKQNRWLSISTANVPQLRTENGDHQPYHKWMSSTRPKWVQDIFFPAQLCCSLRGLDTFEFLHLIFVTAWPF